MSSDFSLANIRRASRLSTGPINPEELFGTLNILDPNVKQLWSSQADALREWVTTEEKDVLLNLSTGAGKTLVGLLIAQAACNERKGGVLYVCSTNQLVDQTIKKAKLYGLGVTLYRNGRFSDAGFGSHRTPCITNYHAAFHAYSKFREHDIGLLILDDAHTAQNIFRSLYSIRLNRTVHQDAYAQIAAAFRPFFDALGQDVSYLNLTTGDSPDIRMIPPFIVAENRNTVVRAIQSLDLQNDPDINYPWGLLQDHIADCAIFLSSSQLTITPAIAPVSTNPVYANSSRRIYLTASLAASDTFIRTFNRRPSKSISPKSDTGDTERCVVLVDAIPDCDGNSSEYTKELARPYKALIISPTYERAKEWDGYASVPERAADLTPILETFKVATDDRKLSLVARYDGMDFPDDACRVLVLDELPAAIDQLERFLWDKLNLRHSQRSLIASRITQMFGRITRSTRDFGTYIVNGPKLYEWLSNEANQDLLPPTLMRQVQSGISISSQLKGIGNASFLVSKALSRDQEWFDLYNDEMGQTKAVQAADLTILEAAATLEVGIVVGLWEGDPRRALRDIHPKLDAIFRINSKLGAWVAYWAAYAFTTIGDEQSARLLYRRASGAAKNVLYAPPRAEAAVERSFQVDNIVSLLQYVDRPDSALRRIAVAETKLEYLDSNRTRDALASTAPSVEVAIEELGNILGFTASRPDDETGGDGPDILWCADGHPVLAFEAKTDKYQTKSPTYNKSDFSSLDAHYRWARKRDVPDLDVIFVGPPAPCSDAASPTDGAEGVSLEELFALSKKAVETLRDAVRAALPTTLTDTLTRLFSERGLLYPNVTTTLCRFKLGE